MEKTKQPLEIITIQEFDKSKEPSKDTSISKYEIISTLRYPDGNKSGNMELYSDSESGLFLSLALTLENIAIKAGIKYGKGFETDGIYLLKPAIDVMVRHHNSFIDKIDRLSHIPK